MSEIFILDIVYGMWGWLIAGVLLIIAELFVPGTFIMWFGFGAILTGLIVWLFGYLTFAMQFLIFILMSILSLSFGFFVYGKVFGRNKEIASHTKTGAQRFIGKSFIVCEKIKNGKGKVRVGDTVWLAQCKKDVEVGQEVVVVGVDGTMLSVEVK